ncbi:MAG: hypothetical protein IJC96_04850, partial [Clostridia bacterium]|nr:hypothetical protein [Clostridia bacterium]
GANTHGGLQGHADAPLPGRMSPSRCKFEELDKYKFVGLLECCVEGQAGQTVSFPRRNGKK